MEEDPVGTTDPVELSSSDLDLHGEISMGNVRSQLEVKQWTVQDDRMGHGTSIELVVDTPDMGLDGKRAYTQASRYFFATISFDVGPDNVDLTST